MFIAHVIAISEGALRNATNDQYGMEQPNVSLAQTAAVLWKSTAQLVLTTPIHAQIVMMIASTIPQISMLLPLLLDTE
jgi:hypothetical protein